MTQLDLFTPAPSGETERNQGMQAAANARPGALEEARRMADKLGREQAYVTMDDVWRFLKAAGWKGDELGNAAGSVFANRRKLWRKTTRRLNSDRKHMHATELTVWEWIGE